MFALVTPSPPPPPPPIILVQQQREASPRLRRRNRDKAFPVEEFVDAVQQHRFLFDRNEPEFKNVAMKEAMWEAIGQQFGISGNKAMSKWRNMRDKYFKLRKQELLNRRLCTPRFRKPVKVWPFYHVMRQLFDSKNTATLEDSQPEAAGGQEDLVAELAFDPAWITNSNADAHDPELASIMTLHMDNGTAVSVKQEPPDETDASEHEASNLVVSGGKDGPAVDSDHEDLETLASLQRSITVARALFHKRRKDFKNAVESFEPRPASVETSDHPGGDCDTLQCDARTQTLTPPPVTAEDGLEHFGLFVAQRLRMTDPVTQVLLLLRSATGQADNDFTPSEQAASCLDVRKLHEIFGTTERAFVAKGAWTAKALGSSTSILGAVSSSQEAICAVTGLGSTGETRMLNPVLLFAQALASEDDTASPTSDVEIHGVTIVLAPNKSTGGWPVAREAAERKMSAHAHTGPLLPRE
ncbi:uncharacterized protein [Dermacentor albipictus]|uniref:uncharacterized protein isoform X2 n=1 Tax=Dermacentor albipictus TaxID=60249 RepID=UPI0038FCE7C0